MESNSQVNGSSLCRIATDSVMGEVSAYRCVCMFITYKRERLSNKHTAIAIAVAIARER